MALDFPRAGASIGQRDGGADHDQSTGPPTGGGAANAAAPTSMPPAKIRPGRVWYLVALAVFRRRSLGGRRVGRALRASDAFPRVPDPGQAVISLTHSGGYVIDYEGPGASNGNVPAGGVHVTAVSRSGPVKITSFSGSMTYQIGSREGSAVANFGLPPLAGSWFRPHLREHHLAAISRLDRISPEGS